MGNYLSSANPRDIFKGWEELRRIGQEKDCGNVRGNVDEKVKRIQKISSKLAGQASAQDQTVEYCLWCEMVFLFRSVGDNARARKALEMAKGTTTPPKQEAERLSKVLDLQQKCFDLVELEFELLKAETDSTVAQKRADSAVKRIALEFKSAKTPLEKWNCACDAEKIFIETKAAIGGQLALHNLQKEILEKTLETEFDSVLRIRYIKCLAAVAVRGEDIDALCNICDSTTDLKSLESFHGWCLSNLTGQEMIKSISEMKENLEGKIWLLTAASRWYFHRGIVEKDEKRHCQATQKLEHALRWAREGTHCLLELTTTSANAVAQNLSSLEDSIKFEISDSKLRLELEFCRRRLNELVFESETLAVEAVWDIFDQLLMVGSSDKDFHGAIRCEAHALAADIAERVLKLNSSAVKHAKAAVFLGESCQPINVFNKEWMQPALKIVKADQERAKAEEDAKIQNRYKKLQPIREELKKELDAIMALENSWEKLLEHISRTHPVPGFETVLIATDLKSDDKKKHVRTAITKYHPDKTNKKLSGKEYDKEYVLREEITKVLNGFYQSCKGS